VHARCDDLTESEVSREQPAVLYGRQVDNCWSSCSKAAERSEAPRNASTTPGCRQLELSPALTPGYGSEPASERVIRLNSQVARAPRIIRRRRDATSRRLATRRRGSDDGAVTARGTDRPTTTLELCKCGDVMGPVAEMLSSPLLSASFKTRTQT